MLIHTLFFRVMLIHSTKPQLAHSG